MLLPLFLLAGAGCFWLLFANVSLGEAESFIPAPLGSEALANYGKDDLPGRLRSLSISIVEAVIRDRDPEEEDIGSRVEDVSDSLKSPVPTVTPKPGDPTGTPTRLPTATSTPDLLVTGTATVTGSPSPSPSPSRTPTATKTDVPTAGPSATPGPSATASKTPTPTKTSTATWTPTPCKVPPEIEIILPLDGTVYGPGSFIEGRARAYDPDDVNPSNCAPSSTADGPGIQQVEFEVIWVDAGPTPLVVYTRIENDVMYCPYIGSGACQTVSVDGGNWPDTTLINDGVHQLRARAKDDNSFYSAWVTVDFTVNLPTPTPTNTPVPPTDTPTPSSTPTPSCPAMTLTGFTLGGQEAWWTLTNGAGTTATIDQVDLTVTFGSDLNKVKLAGAAIWTGDLTSPITINSGWSGAASTRQIGPGSSAEIRLEFESTAGATGYTLDVTFDIGCVASFSN